MMDAARRPGAVQIYDTTLRDGTQREGISLSVDDKLRIARELDALGVHYVEGGWPGSNPKDAEFFERARTLSLPHAKLAAFGSTRHAHTACEDDANVQALVRAGTPVVTLVGKSSVLHVERVLETTREENLRMVGETVAFFKRLGREVVFDAEHFFDGFRLDPAYALSVARAAADAGADCVVLCDTNGGSLPEQVAAAVEAVRAAVSAPLGIHTHDDAGLALANAMAAVRAGCVHVQGTVNGYGERCGNMDLLPLIANLQLKLGYACVPPERLARLTELSRAVAEMVDVAHDTHAPYVGRSAFAHKGGIHVAAVRKVPRSYEHVDPALVGNATRVVVSELAGRGNVAVRARELGLETEGRDRAVLQRVKEMESEGFQFEAAGGSFELLVRRSASGYTPPFELLGFTATAQRTPEGPAGIRAAVSLRVNGQAVHAAADGSGPVDALDRALRQALVPHHPALGEVRVTACQVRTVDAHRGAGARVRVLLECGRGEERWSTTGCSENVVEAAWQAVRDALELPLLRDRDARAPSAPARAAAPAPAVLTPAT